VFSRSLSISDLVVSLVREEKLVLLLDLGVTGDLADSKLMFFKAVFTTKLLTPTLDFLLLFKAPKLNLMF